MKKWDHTKKCHDCYGPCYRDTVRCAYHGLRHLAGQRGMTLEGKGSRRAMWSNPKAKAITKFPDILKRRAA